MSSRPNILFICADHHTWHAIANRSPARTPNLNRLAEEGILFDRSYTPVSVCCPARAMLISGAYPWHNGVLNQVHVPQSVSTDMKPDVVTYAQRLRDSGYRLGYTGKWHASHVRGPLDLGFHEQDASRPMSPEYRERYPEVLEHPYRHDATKSDFRLSGERYVQWASTGPHLMWACNESAPESAPAHVLAERASAMVKRFAEGDQPWHVEVHFQEPHDAYTPLRMFLDNYSIDEIQLPDSYYSETFENKPGLLRREAGLWAEFGENDFRECLRHFYAYCEQVDHFVGRVLQALEETGQKENTLVVFTSDHGDMAGAHRLWIKGWMPYEEGHRIPMVARWPGVIAPGSRSDALVQLHDWAHTFVALAGAEPLPYSDGKDLTPLLRDASTPGPEHVMNVYYGAEFLYTQRILIAHRYKYVFNGFDIDEFYDLQYDPGEVRNAIDDPDYRSEVADMQNALWETMERFGDPYAQSRYGAQRYLPRPAGAAPGVPASA